jgi:Protein of unknown function (DUF1812).
MIKMKLLKIASILILLLLTGCVDENTDDCPPKNNGSLKFSYLDFPEHIQRVDVGIFDKDGMFVESKLVEKNALEEFMGVYLNLDAGEYTAVCWGNAFENTRITNFEKNGLMDDGEVSHPYFGTENKIPTNDPLFYGVKKFTVKNNVVINETVEFTPSHHKIHVYIKGLSVLTYAPSIEEYPVVRINSLAPTINFQNKTCNRKESYYPSVTIDNTKAIASALTSVLLFEPENDITVDVIENATANNILETVNLKEFIERNNIQFPEGKAVTIPILFEFKDGGKVEITVPEWGGSGIIPEM